MADGTATGDSLLVEASADIETIRKGVFGYDPDQAFVITVTTTLQQRSRSYEVWETRAEGGPIRDRVAAIPSGMVFSHYENTAAYDQGTRFFVHLDVFAEPTFSAWTVISEESSGS